MKVLITGGAGFIGTSLVRGLIAENNVGVRVLDNFSRAQTNLVRHPCVEYVNGDVRDKDCVAGTMDGVDVVYHLAAQSSVMGAAADIDYAFSTNVTGTFVVLSAAVERGVRRIVFTSSREVYGQAQQLPVAESAPLGPKNIYGASKAAAEQLFPAFADRGIEAVIFRLANVYGPGDTGRVIPLFCAAAIRNEPLTLYGDNKLLDFISIHDAVECLLRARCAPVAGLTINIGSGAGTALDELAEEICRLAESSSEIRRLEARTIETDRFIADITLAKRVLQFSPAEGLGSLEEVVASLR